MTLLTKFTFIACIGFLGFVGLPNSVWGQENGANTEYSLSSEAEALFEFIKDISGKQTLSGQHCEQPLIQTIVNELTGNGKCPSTGTSGARTAWVMDQICKRIKSHGSPHSKQS